jgi:hypothetical protein
VHLIPLFTLLASYLTFHFSISLCVCGLDRIAGKAIAQTLTSSSPLAVFDTENLLCRAG